MPVASLGPLVGVGVEVVRALEAHGGVEDHFCYGRQSLAKAVLKKGLDGVIGEIILRSFGHGWCCWMFWLTPSRLQLWPDTSNPGRRASPGHRAGIVGVPYFYRQKITLARVARLILKPSNNLHGLITVYYHRNRFVSLS